ncbi:MAG: HAMP domain-containing histidine kinase [Syntrophomonadaceae bacterium]|nr:HAMP domain-containing histidine kinase [Syntrophomonadaceae bacterium]
MKLLWKLFVSTLIITALTFSIGGYLFISSIFQTTLEREKEAAISENKLLCGYFSTVYSTIDNSRNTPMVTSNSLIEGFTNKDTTLRIYNNDREVIIESDDTPQGKDLLSNVDGSTLVHTTIQYRNRYYVQAVAAIQTPNENVYLESYHEISALFEYRAQLFQSYRKTMLIMLLLNGVMVSLITWLTIRPIQKLSKTTREIAGGKYSSRAEIYTQDEVGALAADFNQMADTLETKINDLEAAAVRQQDFMGSFAHELKTPLTSIIGYSDMLRSKAMSAENRILAADYIFSEGKRLESLSLKLLDLLVAQKRSFEMKAVSLKTLFDDIYGIMAPSFDGEGIILEVNAENAIIYAEPDLIKSLLINLLDNSRKAITSQGKVIVSARRISAAEYTIMVEDNGKGIQEQELTRITEAFYIVDKSRSRAYGGSGLGLTLCQRIVELHDGKMCFESVLGQGTTVNLRLRG